MSAKTEAADEKPFKSAPVRSANLSKPKVIVREDDNGTIYVERPDALPPYPDRITDMLEKYAREKPDHTLYASRNVTTGDWDRVSFATALERARGLGQFLIDAGLSEKRPLAILSGNDVEHAQLALAAIHVGIPYAAISPAYSTVSTDFARLKEVFDTINPGMVFAADRNPFANAIEAVAPADCLRMFTRGAQSSETSFAQATTTVPTTKVDAAHASVTPDTIAKFLFTSGSTGKPKAVINTNRMICSNQIMSRETFAFFKDTPPVLLDWAPWHHTAGGNKLFFIPLFNGGTLYVDDGNPTPAGVEKTVRNLKEVSPHWYFNVPKGFDALIPYLRADHALRDNLFRDLKMFWYAGAGMAQHTWDALEQIAVESLGERVIIATGLGATETAPACLLCVWPQEQAGNIGLPAADVSLKLVPMDGKLDARVKGPNITPGYWNEPELTVKAFDEEGYYRFGDALRFANPNDVSAGFFFDGRTAENFKLDTGTWVATGALRTQFIDHFGPLVTDVAIAGADRPYLSALVFPNRAELGRIAELPVDTEAETLFAHPRIRDAFAIRLQKLANAATGSSNRIKSLILVSPPPSLDAGEQTDKGSINQRLVLARRAEWVDELYNGSHRVISV